MTEREGERLRGRNRGEKDMGEERERENETLPTHTNFNNNNNKIRQSHYRFQEALTVISTPTPSLASVSAIFLQLTSFGWRAYNVNDSTNH